MKQIYTHTQSVASTTWTIVHNLNQPPIIDVILNTGEKVLPLAVVAIDANTAEVRFSSAVSGSAQLVGRGVYPQWESRPYVPDAPQEPPPPSSTEFFIYPEPMEQSAYAEFLRVDTAGAATIDWAITDGAFSGSEGAALYNLTYILAESGGVDELRTVFVSQAGTTIDDTVTNYRISPESDPYTGTQLLKEDSEGNPVGNGLMMVVFDPPIQTRRFEWTQLSVTAGVPRMYFFDANEDVVTTYVNTAPQVVPGGALRGSRKFAYNFPTLTTISGAIFAGDPVTINTSATRVSELYMYGSAVETLSGTFNVPDGSDFAELNFMLYDTAIADGQSFDVTLSNAIGTDLPSPATVTATFDLTDYLPASRSYSVTAGAIDSDSATINFGRAGNTNVGSTVSWYIANGAYVKGVSAGAFEGTKTSLGTTAAFVSESSGVVSQFGTEIFGTISLYRTSLLENVYSGGVFTVSPANGGEYLVFGLDGLFVERIEWIQTDGGGTPTLYYFRGNGDLSTELLNSPAELVEDLGAGRKKWAVTFSNRTFIIGFAFVGASGNPAGDPVTIEGIAYFERISTAGAVSFLSGDDAESRTFHYSAQHLAPAAFTIALYDPVYGTLGASSTVTDEFDAQ